MTTFPQPVYFDRETGDHFAFVGPAQVLASVNAIPVMPPRRWDYLAGTVEQAYIRDVRWYCTPVDGQYDPAAVRAIDALAAYDDPTVEPDRASR